MPGEMKKNFAERDCVHRLCNVLKSHPQILAVSEDIRPGCSSNLRAKWDKITGGHSLKLQPQIDILLEDSLFNLLCGIEVKYYQKTIGSSKFNWAYYAGIDEAIATLNYGFHASALWQVFSSETTIKDLKRYGDPFWRHIGKLNLPIDYTMMIDRGTDFDVYNLSSSEPYNLCRLSEIRPIHYHQNPLVNQSFQTELRKILYSWVLGHHPRRYKNTSFSADKLEI
jgi:hypothetical protein